MTVPPETEVRRRVSGKVLWLGLAAALMAMLILANAHLVYIAIGSQPACVPHAKSAGEAGTFRAARPAC
ncbi:hypothetical protein [Bosea sp. NBC_00550]|uniref:hypothetical protein n=1 Tax=Bosea sp. NBC_00550 TaxID=2969621 RepID=UPI00222E6D85|nr:hypothetical protein [Bosea sp. NBC_00550]UZF95436.1 hypothetical protein NWE53_28555 [Bosea sp. NBC_00550]